MKDLFSKELCNTGRQIEFDIAKAVCILGMVFVHCFEQLALPVTEESSAYYIMTIVLDALFGAATFMGAMGLGIAYSLKDEREGGKILMSRGVKIFILGYVLGFVRYGLPAWLFGAYSDKPIKIIYVSLTCDIMPFAGLALLLLGLFKWLKVSDKGIFGVALGMSVLGSFIRFIPVEDPIVSMLLGDFIGTRCTFNELYSACFPVPTWFIFVVGGYLYGKALRHCKDVHKYYKIILPVSALILAIYLAVAIPNGLGMMNENILYYYQMTTFDALFCFIGMVFVTSVYHFISLILGDKVKKVIQSISSNINRVYCIHWVIIGFLDMYLISKGDTFGLSTPLVFVLGCIIYIVSNLLAALYTKYNKKKEVYK